MRLIGELKSKLDAASNEQVKLKGELYASQDENKIIKEKLEQLVDQN